MTKLDALWAYQEAELAKAQLETEIRSTPSRLQFNKLHKLLKSQQAAITQMGDDMDAREAQLAKLLEQAQKLEDRVEMELSELQTMQQDEESTAEEMTELRGDVEKLVGLLQNVMKELAEIRKMLKEGARSNGR